MLIFPHNVLKFAWIMQILTTKTCLVLQLKGATVCKCQLEVNYFQFSCLFYQIYADDNFVGGHWGNKKCFQLFMLCIGYLWVMNFIVFV